MCEICERFFPLVRKKLKKEAIEKTEWWLYVNIWFNSFGGSLYSLHKDLYTVINWEVYILEEKWPYATRDCVVELSREKRIGKYNPNKKYKWSIRQFNYWDLMKTIKFKK